MKTNLFKLTFWVLVVGFSFSSIGCNSIHTVHGNGDLMTSERTVSAFQQISSTDVAEVRFFTSEEQRVVVTVDSNLYEYVEISTRNGVLNIGTKRGSYNFTRFLVEIHSPTLTGVTMSGSGSFFGEDKIVTPNFHAVLSGSGRMEGTFETETFSARLSGSGRLGAVVETNEFSATVSGSGRIVANGNSESTGLTISGSGNFDGNNFNTTSATVTISGTGNVNICVEESLNARISGSGSVNYCGNPTVNANVTGTGRVRPM